MTDALDRVFAYHEISKHGFHAYAPGPGRLDWETQPDPFRRYAGARLIPLEKVHLTQEPSYDRAYDLGCVAPTRLDLRSVSQLFFDSLALSAWKRAGSSTWALRVNPSSGNLHPTEGYLLCGPVQGLCDWPLICHYAPKEHALEVRAELSADLWQKLSHVLPRHAILVGLTSIHWREAWKYGERAYRYCQHDVGHALGAIALAASGLGWQATLLDDLGSDQLADLLGVSDARGAESEQADCLLAVYPHGNDVAVSAPSSEAIVRFRALDWQGRPNRLSRSLVRWPHLEDVVAAAHKPATREVYGKVEPPALSAEFQDRRISLRRIIHQRRSAVDMDGVSSMPRDAFYRILARTLPGAGCFPFNALPWPPCVHLALFVHRVDGLPPGLYLLIRNPESEAALRESLAEDFLWQRPENCPDQLPLYRLAQGDTRHASMQVSCFQEIASDGCFSLGMIAELEGPLSRYDPWFYPRLFWECGMIGQVLYLEAEAAGLRGTGIGCFFDDPMHQVLGLEGRRFQDLYHFTVGGPVEDARLTTLPPYPGLTV